MRQQKVISGEGSPITATSPEQLKRQGAADGAAAKAAGLGPDSPVSASTTERIIERFHAEACLVANLVGLRHHKPIGEANEEVVKASNKLSLAAGALATKKAELAEAETEHRGFFQRIIELLDAPLDLTGTESEPSGSPQISCHVGAAGVVGGAGRTEAPPDDPEEGPALRYAWRRGLSPWVVVPSLGTVATAEFGLSARAFQSIREQEWVVLLLAGLVGVAVVSLSHRIGDNLAHLLEQPRRAKGRSPQKLVEICFEIPALVIGIAGVAVLRSSYFRIERIAIPTVGLVCLQLMLAAAATGITMAGHSDAADEIRDRARFRVDLAYAVDKRSKSYFEAEQVLVGAERTLRHALSELVLDYGVQVTHVKRSMLDYYLPAFSEAAGVLIDGPLPEAAPPQLVVQAEDWLRSHPVGTLAHVELPYSAAPGAQPEDMGEPGWEDRVQRPNPQGVFDFGRLDNEEQAA